MEDDRKRLCLEMARIAEKATTSNALVEDQKNRLEQQTKEIEELNESVQTTIKEVSEAESKLWQLETNRKNVMKEIRETRKGCYQTGQDIDALNTILQDCQLLCHNISNCLTANCDILEIEKMLEALENLLNEKYEDEKRKISEVEDHYKTEIAAREKQLGEIENDIKNLEAKNLEEKKVVLERIIEENEMKLKDMHEENQNLLCEIDKKKTKLKEELSEFAEEEKNLAQKFEEIEQENCKLLEEITLYKEELDKLHETDSALSAEMQAQKEEEQKLQASLESVRTEVNNLKLEETVAEFRIKHTLETNSSLGFKYDNSLTEKDNLEQCKVFLSNQIDLLEGQKEEYQLSRKTHEEKICEIHEEKQMLTNRTHEAELQIKKLKSERLILELEFNETHFELNHDTEKQSNELDVLKEQVNAKAKALEILNDEIKQIETDYNAEQKEFCEKQSELDTAVQRLDVEKKTLIQQLSEATENLKKLTKECDDLTYDIVKLENKKSQLIAPEKEAAVRFKKPRRFDDTSESDVETYSDYQKAQKLMKVKLHKSKKK